MRPLKIQPNKTERSNNLQRFYQDVRSYELLTPEEEVNLIIKAQAGDGKARERLINSNLRFCISTAKYYQSCGLALEDLIQDAVYGFQKAINRFDVTKGFKFISYAVF